MSTKQFIIYIPIGTKQYPLLIRNDGKYDPKDGALVHISCKEANIDQDHLKSDLPLLFEDIGAMIETEQATKKDDSINIRVKAKDKIRLQQYAVAGGYRSLSEYLLAKGLQNA